MDKINFSQKTILKILRRYEELQSKYPNSMKVSLFKRWDSENIEDFIVEVRYQYLNYISLIRELFDTDELGFLGEDGFMASDFSLIPSIEVLLRRLQDDGYIIIEKQKCLYRTDYGRKIESDGFDIFDTLLDAKKFFSEEERGFLERSIILTTKGKSYIGFGKERFLSEPIGIISLIISIISIIISVFLK